MRKKLDFCKRGHPYSGENLYVNPTNGRRTCRECQRLRQNLPKWKAYAHNWTAKKSQDPNYRAHRIKTTRVWQAKNVDRCKNNYLKRQYNTTLEEYNKQILEQAGLCAACHRPLDLSGKAPPVDHDHACCPGHKSCGKCNRGVIHEQCNKALGCINDDLDILRHLIQYIENWKAKKQGNKND
jgi:hypothetical protein